MRTWQKPKTGLCLHTTLNHTPCWKIMTVYGIKQKCKWPLRDRYLHQYIPKESPCLGPTVIEKAKLGVRLKEFYCIYKTVMPMKIFVRCVGDLATVGGSVLVMTSFWLLPDSFFVCLQRLGISKFILLWRFTYALAELSFWDVVTGARRTRGTLTIWAHTQRQHKCIAGCWVLVFFKLRFTVYRLF